MRLNKVWNKNILKWVEGDAFERLIGGLLQSNRLMLTQVILFTTKTSS